MWAHLAIFSFYRSFPLYWLTTVLVILFASNAFKVVLHNDGCYDVLQLVYTAVVYASYRQVAWIVAILREPYLFPL